MRITVSAPTTFASGLEAIACEPKPRVTSSDTFAGVLPAPRPHPASASAARSAAPAAGIDLAVMAHPHGFEVALRTQMRVSVRVVWGALTRSQKRPGFVEVIVATPPAALFALVPAPLTVAPAFGLGLPAVSE